MQKPVVAIRGPSQEAGSSIKRVPGAEEGVLNGYPKANGSNGVKGLKLNGSNGLEELKVNGAASSRMTDDHSATGDGLGESFLRKVFHLLLEEGIRKFTDPESKVLEFLQPSDLMKEMNFDLCDDPEPDQDVLLDYCRQTIQYSVKTGHPHFFNQLYGGYDAYGLAGSFLTETINPSLYTYEVAPVFTIMEKVVLKKMREIVGWTTGDGMFNPGGSISNMYAVNVARYHLFPETKEMGMHGVPNLCILTSEQCHYSVQKTGMFLGIGTNNVINVATDARGKMIPEELERSIEKSISQGLTPFVVVATTGTTVLGAFDPLSPIADICERHGLWLHVDGAWGGGALLSQQHRHLLSGIERADSVTWNPHKLMGTTQQCSAFLTKHQDLLVPCNSTGAKYLFQTDKYYDCSYDTGEKSIQCGRKVDVFKLWLMWKAKGTVGFEKRINQAFDNARYLTETLKTMEDFRLVIEEPECTNVCFWYIPPSLRGQKETPDWWKKLGAVAPALKKRMVSKGSMMITYNEHMQYVSFFRIVVISELVSRETMDFVISELRTLGQDL